MSIRTAVSWMRERTHRRGFPWAVLGLAAVMGIPLGVIGALATEMQYRDSPPPCYGLGWGCSLDPGSSGLLVGVMWSFAVGCVALLLALSELFWKRVAPIRSWMSLLMLAAVVAFTLLLTVIALTAAFWPD